MLGLLDSAFRGNQRTGVSRLKQSAAINPDDPLPLFWLIVAYAGVGRPEAADLAARRLKLIDPLTLTTQVAAPMAALFAGRYRSALEFPWHDLPPVPWVVYHALTLAYNLRLDAADAFIRSSVPVESDDTFSHLPA